VATTADWVRLSITPSRLPKTREHVKKHLINKLPWLYFPLRALYRLTPVYAARVERLERERAARSARIRQRNREIMADVFGNVFEIRGGPFAGMAYVERSTGGALLPKIAGSYEEPIQDWIERAIARRYARILDIGCAEGYYAVGLARRLPESAIIAYDINVDARGLCRDLAAINGVTNVDVRPSCDFSELAREIVDDTLIVCDIEGGERELLDPRKVPGLADADLIIECHDSYLPGITDLLIDRFEATHAITIAVDDSVRRRHYALPKPVSDVVLAEIIDENRAKDMKFLFCECCRRNRRL